MLGAIIGDIVGSRFEFHNHRNKKFDLFTKYNFYTDDSVCTCGIASSLLKINNNKEKTDKEKSKLIANELRHFCIANPHRGYGGSFFHWIYTPNGKPYYSWGNGSAMRVSSVGWVANSEEEVKHLSHLVTAITHDHPYALHGAEVTAMCIFYARQGKTKHEIYKYVKKEYPEIKYFDYNELRKHYYFNEEAKNTVPQAIYCFLLSNSFEDCLRTTVSIGGDTDTLCAISCAIAEAYYGIPEEFKTEILQYFTDKQKEMLLVPVNEIAKNCGIDNYIIL